jgi:hypothetical protein
MAQVAQVDQIPEAAQPVQLAERIQVKVAVVASAVQLHREAEVPVDLAL